MVFRLNSFVSVRVSQDFWLCCQKTIKMLFEASCFLPEKLFSIAAITFWACILLCWGHKGQVHASETLWMSLCQRCLPAVLTQGRCRTYVRVKRATGWPLWQHCAGLFACKPLISAKQDTAQIQHWQQQLHKAQEALIIPEIPLQTSWSQLCCTASASCQDNELFIGKPLLEKCSDSLQIFDELLRYDSLLSRQNRTCA